jgi:molybdate transport system ATP-binding protein
MTPALEVAVARHIGEFQLDVAFTAESGISVLFGPSGAGKTLTLALIAGLIRPDTGTIVINGHVVTDCARRVHVSTQERHIGMVFQDGMLFPHRSVLDNVALAVRQASMRKERRAVARSWLQRVGAEEFAHRRPGSLSGGQRQRVALARGLAGDPALVLLDEPLSALDVVVRREMRQLIREVIITSGIPAVLVTHDPQEAEELGDVIIVYSDGRVSETRVIERPPPPEAEWEGRENTEPRCPD